MQVELVKVLNNFQPVMSDFKLDVQHKKINRLDHQREQ